MNFSTTHPLIDRVQREPVTTLEQRIVHFLLKQNIVSMVVDLRDYFYDIVVAQAALSQVPKESLQSIEYNNKCYPIYPIAAKSVQLHSSLHAQMDHALWKDRELYDHYNLLKNYISALVLLAKNLADYKALYPDFLHADLIEIIDTYLPSLRYQCWRPQPTLSDDTIAAFLKRHATPIRILQVQHLDTLTR